jgi:hypothetical protein
VAPFRKTPRTTPPTQPHPYVRPRVKLAHLTRTSARRRGRFVLLSGPWCSSVFGGVWALLARSLARSFRAVFLSATPHRSQRERPREQCRRHSANCDVDPTDGAAVDVSGAGARFDAPPLLQEAELMYDVRPARGVESDRPEVELALYGEVTTRAADDRVQRFAGGSRQRYWLEEVFCGLPDHRVPFTNAATSGERAITASIGSSSGWV